ncbi:MAG: hypothetical protein JOZ01_02805 [Candidatus Eremiobacteraeota bacterium]|nr:hypothetical protein [Candidatus Eremiobacteraeota bacterium]
MARIRPLAAALAFAVALGLPASAQSLQRLTVTQLTLASTQSAPKVEIPFDLVVTARVRERVTELRDVRLPVLTDVELLGDERSVVNDASGTTYTERIRVVAHHSGTIAIAPVTLDAIDARDGRAKRYSSNALTLVVGGISPVGVGASATFLEALRTAVLWIVGLGALTVIVIALARRRPGSTAAVPVAEPLATAPVRVMSRDSVLRDARAVLAAERSRAAVLRVRHAVREMVGAGDDETLDDVLHRADSLDRPFRALLVALERAAFTYDEDLQRSIDAVLQSLSDAAA